MNSDKILLDMPACWLYISVTRMAWLRHGLRDWKPSWVNSDFHPATGRVLGYHQMMMTSFNRLALILLMLDPVTVAGLGLMAYVLTA